jgi:AcrR family transcriptional regulator
LREEPRQWRITKEQAVHNRERILAAAERLFRQKGVDAVGVAELMKEAGFTQGGFYNHFASKEALVSEVVGKPWTRVNSNSEQRSPNFGA